MKKMSANLVDGTKPKMNALLVYMQLETMPYDEFLDPAVGYWWIVRKDRNPIAFLGMTTVDENPNWGYIARVGVLPEARGKGIQKHLMRVAERRARQLGWSKLISTTLNNPPSANSFIACGYKTYEPAGPWGYTGTIYWMKDL
jgi:GNAT superfamily N-acetyltransferase